MLKRRISGRGLVFLLTVIALAGIWSQLLFSGSNIVGPDFPAETIGEKSGNVDTFPFGKSLLVTEDIASIIQREQEKEVPKVKEALSAYCQSKCKCAKFERTSARNPLTQFTQLDEITCRVENLEGITRLKSHGLFLCPQQYRNLADWVFAWNAGHHDESLDEATIQDIVAQVPDCLPEGSIIYAVGWHLDAFFNQVYPLLKNKFILITGESDLSVPFGHHLKYVTEDDSKIIHWFGQNGPAPDPKVRFTSIPIGLNCFEHGETITLLREKQFNAAAMSSSVVRKISVKNLQDPHFFFPPRQDLNLDKDKLLLLNFDPTTDSSGGRMVVWDLGCKAETPNHWMEFTHCVHKDRGVRQYMANLGDIYTRNQRFPFWLSPRGNGLDCHRTWEAMYFGVIPIVLSSEMDFVLEKLPVVIVKSWSEISRDFLKTKYREITINKRGQYDLSRIYLPYWEKIILQKSRHSSESTRGHRCWWSTTV